MQIRYGLILCEGGTEERYFREMAAHLLMRGKLQRAMLEIYRPKDHSPKGLLDEAKKRIARAEEEELPPFDFIWLVFDKDDHSSTASAFYEANQWKGRPAIRVAFSAHCFEYYLLLHFEQTTRPFRTCREAVNRLKQHLPAYEKSLSLYSDLYKLKYQAFRNCEFAMKQAARDLERGLQPYQLSAFTNVHELEYFLEAL